jgi:biotin synthase
MTKQILEKVDRNEELTRDEIIALLEVSDPNELQALYDCAYRIKEKQIGKVVHFRGLIECSNICIKDCYYCGIRKSNSEVERFLMDEDEIVKEALWSFENQYGSAVIQAGERTDETFISLIERALIRIKKETGGKLGMTLSLG